MATDSIDDRNNLDFSKSIFDTDVGAFEKAALEIWSERGPFSTLLQDEALRQGPRMLDGTMELSCFCVHAVATNGETVCLWLVNTFPGNGEPRSLDWFFHRSYDDKRTMHWDTELLESPNLAVSPRISSDSFRQSWSTQTRKLIVQPPLWHAIGGFESTNGRSVEYDLLFTQSQPAHSHAPPLLGYYAPLTVEGEIRDGGETFVIEPDPHNPQAIRDRTIVVGSKVGPMPGSFVVGWCGKLNFVFGSHQDLYADCGSGMQYFRLNCDEFRETRIENDPKRPGKRVATQWELVYGSPQGHKLEIQAYAYDVLVFAPPGAPTATYDFYCTVDAQFTLQGGTSPAVVDTGTALLEFYLPM